MGQQSSLHTSCLMGAWIIDMADLDAAHCAIALCKTEVDAALEVRHTLWGVQVRTDSESAAECLGRHYTPAGIALAA